MCLHGLLNHKDINDFLHNAGGLLLHVIQDLLSEAWAKCMASVITSAALVTFRHVIVLLALCFLLLPI